MRALCIRRYGTPEVLQVEERPLPDPAAKEVRVQIVTTSVTMGDCKLRGLVGMSPLFKLLARLMFGMVRPRQQVAGSVFAGTVDALGPDVDNFAIGDRVFGIHLFGTHAEYCCVHVDKGIARIPDACSFSDAAALAFGGSTAVYFLKKAGLEAGMHVLIIGAGGGVGTVAVQVARAMGATVDALVHARHRDLLATLGVSSMYDYQSDDPRELHDRYDLILDCSGRYRYGRLRHTMKPGAHFIPIDFGLGMALRAIVVNLSKRHRIDLGVSEDRPWVMEHLAKLMAAGDVQAVIDKRYDFNDIPAAHAYVQGSDADQGKTRFGSVLVTMKPSS